MHCILLLTLHCLAIFSTFGPCFHFPKLLDHKQWHIKWYFKLIFVGEYDLSETTLIEGWRSKERRPTGIISSVSWKWTSCADNSSPTGPGIRMRLSWVLRDWTQVMSTQWLSPVTKKAMLCWTLRVVCFYPGWGHHWWTSLLTTSLHLPNPLNIHALGSHVAAPLLKSTHTGSIQFQTNYGCSYSNG